MLVVGDESHDRGRLPWITFTLIAVNLAVFAAQYRFGDAFSLGYALVPIEITSGIDLSPDSASNIPGTDGVAFAPNQGTGVKSVARAVPQFKGPEPIYLTLLTYQFLHADVFHLLFNMWFLFVFGRNVECALGSLPFLNFYLVCGIIAGLAQVSVAPQSVTPIVGASGSIAGVMGAYLAIFPWNKLKVCYGMLVGIPAGVVQIPAFLFVGFWIAGQIALGWAKDETLDGGGVAYWCHIGGFLAGFAVVKVLAIVYGVRLRVAKPAKEDTGPIANLDPVAAYRRGREGVFSEPASELSTHVSPRI